MTKFKIGDRVRVLHTDYHDHIPIGTETHVVDADDDGDGVHLWCEEYPEGLCFYGSEVELLDPYVGPVRTVTRKEIVPGTYGTVTVRQTNCGEFAYSVEKYATAEQLRDAARIFIEIADALEPTT